MFSSPNPSGVWTGILSDTYRWVQYLGPSLRTKGPKMDDGILPEQFSRSGFCSVQLWTELGGLRIVSIRSLRHDSTTGNDLDSYRSLAGRLGARKASKSARSLAVQLGSGTVKIRSDPHARNVRCRMARKLSQHGSHPTKDASHGRCKRGERSKKPLTRTAG